jgi:hypothetical protein
LIIVSSCSPGGEESHEASPSENESPPTRWLISREDARHDLGHRIAIPGRTIEYRYRLRNAAPHPVSIANVENLKPCCGTIALESRTLDPGESAEAVLTLSLGDGTNPNVVHEAVVHTEPPSPDPIILRTTALVQPIFRVEEMEGFANLQILKSEPPRQPILRITAYGTSTEPAADFENAVLEASIPVSWISSVTEVASGSGFTERTRRFRATLDASSLTEGPRATSVRIRLNEQTVLEHVIRWEVVAPITAAPRMIVLSQARPEFQLALRAMDDATFQVVQMEAPSGVSASTVQNSPATLHRIRVTWDGTTLLPKNKANLRVRTDHHAQSEIQIRIAVLQ